MVTKRCIFWDQEKGGTYIPGGPLRRVDGAGVPGRGEGISGLFVSRVDEITGRTGSAEGHAAELDRVASELGSSELPLATWMSSVVLAVPNATMQGQCRAEL